MSLLPVDLDASPDRITGFLAADAAVRAAVGLDFTPPTPAAQDWSDGHGLWLSLVRPGDGRALLVGWHPEFSLTEGTGTAGEAGTDLVGDAPGWWRRGIEHARSVGTYVGFLYGWDGANWWRFDQPVDDGYDPEIFPVTDLALTDIVTGLAADTLLDDPEPAAVAALAQAGPYLDEDLLGAVLRSPDGWPEVDVAAGLEAARSFRTLVASR